MDGSVQADLILAGERPAGDVAAELAGWIGRAERSLDVAIYDFQAGRGAAAAVADALEAAGRRGVGVRVVFNLDRGPNRPPWPPAPKCHPGEIDGLEVPTRGVHGQGSLMHHKFVVRDGREVWTGSMNWTDDAFALEENVVVRVASEAVALAYGRDFEQLWSKGHVGSSGGQGGQVRLDGTLVRPAFSPRGPSLAHLAASRIGEARHRLRVLSPVITSGPVLGTLAEFAGRRAFDLAGAYDLTQMEEVERQWQAVPANHWKIDAWKVIAPRLSGKRSTPYADGAVHDYMHAKAVVADGEVVTGSYNFSRGGEENAENVLHLQGQDVAEAFAAYAERVAERYARPQAGA